MGRAKLLTRAALVAVLVAAGCGADDDHDGGADAELTCTRGASAHLYGVAVEVVEAQEGLPTAGDEIALLGVAVSPQGRTDAWSQAIGSAAEGDVAVSQSLPLAGFCLPDPDGESVHALAQVIAVERDLLGASGDLEAAIARALAREAIRRAMRNSPYRVWAPLVDAAVRRVIDRVADQLENDVLGACSIGLEIRPDFVYGDRLGHAACARDSQLSGFSALDFTGAGGQWTAHVHWTVRDADD